MKSSKIIFRYEDTDFTSETTITTDCTGPDLVEHFSRFMVSMGFTEKTVARSFINADIVDVLDDEGGE